LPENSAFAALFLGQISALCQIFASRRCLFRRRQEHISRDGPCGHSGLRGCERLLTLFARGRAAQILLEIEQGSRVEPQPS